MNDLRGETIKLWLYLSKNQEDYRFELSPKDAAAWGLKKDSYYKAIDTLIEKGYLSPVSEGSNTFIFFEAGASEIQKQKEETKMVISEIQNISSEKQKAASEKQKAASELPERNIINNTNILKENTTEKEKEKGITEKSKMLLKRLNDDMIADKFDAYELGLIAALNGYIRQNKETAPAAEIYEEISDTYDIIYALAR